MIKVTADRIWLE